MQQIAPGVVRLAAGIANVYLVGERGGPWALVDTGPPGQEDGIREAAQERFGTGARPEAILLTHGHPDHSGSARALAEAWDVPVYAHSLELPYVDGRSPYPPLDPTVGGFLAGISRLFASQPAHLGPHGRALPEGEVPGLPGWRWLPTPGHSPGHVSYYRAEDGVLLAGDALATVDLDSLFAVVSGKPEICRPPSPSTCDWLAARESAARLAALRPRCLAAGHGEPLSGPQVAEELAAFAARFPIPARGRYVRQPARTGPDGIVELPPPEPDLFPVAAAALAGAAVATTLLLGQEHSRRRR